ncbi:hypothetical protein GZ78_17125 [Endozoicomonas numazuensis]|uniref:Uncharacterized protein n=1 Tax=Endozoicomonas numazuensis TaxID=1137799 RepID=A0A081NGB2_9GAMM|nr:hypothetical protein GZ78_17125 [Endozoicomonas numazuensis]
MEYEKTAYHGRWLFKSALSCLIPAQRTLSPILSLKAATCIAVVRALCVVVMNVSCSECMKVQVSSLSKINKPLKIVERTSAFYHEKNALLCGNKRTMFLFMIFRSGG